MRTNTKHSDEIDDEIQIQKVFIEFTNETPTIKKPKPKTLKTKITIQTYGKKHTTTNCHSGWSRRPWKDIDTG